MLCRRVIRRHQVARRVGELRQPHRFDRNRLRRRGLFVRHVAGRHRLLLDAVDRLAGLPVQNVEIAGLGGHPQRRNRAAVGGDVEQRRRRRRVGVPQIVMNRLEMPAIVAGLDIHRDHGVAILVVAGTVAAVVTGNRRRQRQIHQPALLVEREVERPRVGAQPTAPTVPLPGIVTGFARLRHRIELPHLGATHRVERARVADTADRAGRCVCADDDDIAVNERDRVVRDHHVDGAAVAEVGHRLAAGGIERAQVQPGGEDDARRQPVAAGPVGDPAPRRTRALDLMTPDLGPRHRVERDHAVSRRHVHDAGNDNRRGLRVRSPLPFRLRVERIGPGLCQGGHVGGGDRTQRRGAGGRQIIAIHRPVAADRGRVRPGRRRGHLV